MTRRTWKMGPLHRAPFVVFYAHSCSMRTCVCYPKLAIYQLEAKLARFWLPAMLLTSLKFTHGLILNMGDEQKLRRCIRTIEAKNCQGSSHHGTGDARQTKQARK
ncbi:hypothetical protein BDR07DRAFT_1414603 [Suillus spraguei]|nr:hypothetical protein BDR07DRAFT_1414603 [Suillus spraguei]